MAIIGVSKPYVALYKENGDGTISYANGALLARATELSATIENGDSNNLYADNGIAETDRTFGGGTLTIGVDELNKEGSMLILGAKTATVTVGSKSVSEIIFDDDTEAPYLGFGCIIKKKVNGGIKWRAVIFTKILFAIPEDAATTQGETIEWQTPTIEATIARDDSTKHMWKREATFDSEVEAMAYIKTILNITQESMGALTVASIVGSTSGRTKISVTPPLLVGNSYKYKTGTNLTSPVFDAVCASDYTAWDGTADIVATSGQNIMVVEVDGFNKAKKVGTVAVVAKA